MGLRRRARSSHLDVGIRRGGGYGAREGERGTAPPLVNATQRQDFPHRVCREMGADPCPQAEAGPTPPAGWCGGPRRHQVFVHVCCRTGPSLLLYSTRKSLAWPRLSPAELAASLFIINYCSLPISFLSIPLQPTHIHTIQQ